MHITFLMRNDKKWDKIKYLINAINGGIGGKYEKDFMKSNLIQMITCI